MALNTKKTDISCKILHITPHLGGGVGTVLLNWLTFDKEFKHSIITLDYANEEAIKKCNEINIELYSEINKEKIFDLITKNDIVIMHFWNHPLLYNFIINNTLPECRLIIWSHISGLIAPNIITEKILAYPDVFIYTTPISRELKENKVILSTGGIDKLKNIELIPHNGFTVGYIGTVDYAKMHPKYVETLSKTTADKFIILGGNQEKEISKNADKRFHFLGKVSDIIPYLQKMDILGYLLNPKHFGTAEQVIQEAMAVGVVPVVLNNKCEKSLVIHNETGLIANNLEEYIEYINKLKNNKNLLEKLKLNGKNYAKNNFSLNKLNKIWHETFDDILKNKKTIKSWQSSRKIKSSYDIFLESIGSFDKIFINNSKEKIKEILKDSVWQSNSKGTPKQYFNFLKGQELERICELYEK